MNYAAKLDVEIYLRRYFFNYIYAVIGDVRTLVFCSQWDLISEPYLVIQTFFFHG
jgi:hypothetical protein